MGGVSPLFFVCLAVILPTAWDVEMRGILTVAFIFVVGFFSVPVSVAAEQSNAYMLHAGDSVQVSVWREDSLQKEVKVLPDGSITFPLVGRVEVAGFSTSAVEKRIVEKLKEFIPDPIVTVVIMGVEGNRAYVLGKVLKPGPMILSGPTNVLQALSIAGGLDKFADEGAIKLIRNTANGQTVVPVHYRDLIGGRDLTTNIEVMAGDTLLVP